MDVLKTSTQGVFYIQTIHYHRKGTFSWYLIPHTVLKPQFSIENWICAIKQLGKLERIRIGCILNGGTKYLQGIWEVKIYIKQTAISRRWCTPMVSINIYLHNKEKYYPLYLTKLARNDYYNPVRQSLHWWLIFQNLQRDFLNHIHIWLVAQQKSFPQSLVAQQKSFPKCNVHVTQYCLLAPHGDINMGQHYFR